MSSYFALIKQLLVVIITSSSVFNYYVWAEKWFMAPVTVLHPYLSIYSLCLYQWDLYFLTHSCGWLLSFLCNLKSSPWASLNQSFCIISQAVQRDPCQSLERSGSITRAAFCFFGCIIFPLVFLFPEPCICVCLFKEAVTLPVFTDWL